MNPGMIVIGGGITVQKDYLYPLIMEQLKQDVMPAVLDSTKIEIAQNLNNAGMIGALRHFLLQESLQPLKSITTMLESSNHKLTKGEKVIATHDINNLETVPTKTICQLANKINVSEASITRFCKKLEFGSYNKLRLIAKEALVSTRIYEHRNSTSISETNQTYHNILSKFDMLLEMENIQTLIKEINDTQHVYLLATGDLQAITEVIKYKFLQKGIHANIISNEQYKNIPINFIKDNSLVFGISISGYSDRIISVLEKTRRNGAKTVCITSQQDSPLAKVADLPSIIP